MFRPIGTHLSRSIKLTDNLTRTKSKFNYAKLKFKVSKLKFSNAKLKTAVAKLKAAVINQFVLLPNQNFHMLT